MDYRLRGRVRVWEGFEGDSRKQGVAGDLHTPLGFMGISHA